MALTNLVRAALPVVSLGMYNPENYGALGGSENDTQALQDALDAAGAAGGGTVLLTQMHNITGVSVPSNVTLRGTGPGTGVYAATAPSAQATLVSVAGSYSVVADMDILLRTDGAGSIGDIRMYGVWVATTAQYCRLSNLNINGRYNNSVMGFTNGVRMTGNYNVMEDCTVLWCSMGTTARGSNLTFKGNLWCNYYTSAVGTTWSSSSPYWDGFAGEGLIDCVITGNRAVENGQSGIYLGGGGSGYTSGVIISNNTSIENWNRGIDTGISGTQSATNDVTGITIEGNHVRNNRETQVWLYGTNESRVIGNSIVETAEYTTLYGIYGSSTRAGIALGLSSACINNVISGNRISVQSTTPYSVVYNGTGHKLVGNRVTGGATAYVFGSDAARLYSNSVDSYQGTFTPSLVVASGVTLSSSSGRYRISNGVLTFDITLTMSGSSPSGALTLGYIPGLSTATLQSRQLSVGVYNGWNTTLGNATLKAVFGSSNDQLQIVRLLNGSYGQDAAAYVGSSSTISISGVVVTTPSYSGS